MKALTDYFKQGCKGKDDKFQIGLELEHFIVEKVTKKSIDYYGKNGVESVLKELSTKFERSTTVDNHLLSLERKDVLITLEPASQMEVSITPQHHISKIEKIYHDFLDDIFPVLEKYGYQLENKGYLPCSSINEISLIPKKRYQYMESYFNQSDSYGKYMMKGTASTHVSIDYSSEKDFSAKYKLAYLLSPILAFAMENTPIFEGKKYKGHLLRDKIWESVDSARFRTEPFWKENEIDFEGYASFVLQSPLILDISSKEEQYTVNNAAVLYEDKAMKKEDVEHVLSMVFPEIRLKQYIEIRTADSNPFPKIIRYLEKIQNIFGSAEKVSKILALFSSISLPEVALAKKKIRAQGQDAIIYGKPINEWLQILDMEDLKNEYE